MAQIPYVLGRGEVHLSRFVPGTTDEVGFRYIGNTPEFNMTIESENLEHFSSDRGIREKDASVPLEVNRMATMTTDVMDVKNVALFFFGQDQTIAQASATGLVSTIVVASRTFGYQIGVTPTNALGARGLAANPVVARTLPTASPLAAGVDYDVDLDTGFIRFRATSTLVPDGCTVTVTYGLLARSYQLTVSGSEAVPCAIRYIAYNPTGPNTDYYMPLCNIRPNGDLALKSDEWQTMSFMIDILKPVGREAIYAAGRPFTP